MTAAVGRFMNGVPQGRGQAVGCAGAMEEQNRRTLAAMANDRFVMALYHARMAEVDLANKIERELNGGQSNEERAQVVEAEYLTPFERAMERVRQGAGIIEVRPINRRVEPSYTLGGVSSI